MTKLNQALSSQYLKASQRLQGLKYNLVRVFVEGYDDVSFWRGIFDKFKSDSLRFEVSVPMREDLAKGKKVVLELLPQCGPNLVVCVDSDFDYLFGNFNHQSTLVNNSPYLFQTYAYSIENYLCYPPSLHSLCVKATKNDRAIFDFEIFMREYSKIIYPLFLWYALSAQKSTKKAFTLVDFKNSVRINYVDVKNNGEETLAWLARQVEKRRHILEHKHPDWFADLNEFEHKTTNRGLAQENIHLFMQGHTLKENVVMVLLQAVCLRLREMSSDLIMSSERRGLSLKNELSNYNNSLRNVKDLLSDNQGYEDCTLYKKLIADIERFVGQQNNIQ